MGHSWGRVILTARGSAWVRTRGGCTACTGRRGRPGWPGSPVPTAGRPPAAAGSRSSLKQHTPSVPGARPTGCAAAPSTGNSGKGFCYARPNRSAPTREQHLLFRCSVGSFDCGFALLSQPAVFSCSPHRLGSNSVLCGQCTSHQLSSQISAHKLLLWVQASHLQLPPPADLEPGSPRLVPTFQEAGNLLQLRDVVLIVATEFLQ